MFGEALGIQTMMVYSKVVSMTTSLVAAPSQLHQLVPVLMEVPLPQNPVHAVLVRVIVMPAYQGQALAPLASLANSAEHRPLSARAHLLQIGVFSMYPAIANRGDLKTQAQDQAQAQAGFVVISALAQALALVPAPILVPILIATA